MYRATRLMNKDEMAEKGDKEGIKVENSLQVRELRLILNTYLLLQPLVEPAEEGALPEDTILGAQHPVVFFGEEEHLGRNAA